jgi:hypothetical protein
MPYSFPAIWPVRTLRLLASTIPSLFFIPILEVYAGVLHCDYNTSGWPSQSLTGHEYCTSPVLLSMIVISLVCMLVFVPISLGFSLFYLNLGKFSACSDHPSESSLTTLDFSSPSPLLRSYRKGARIESARARGHFHHGHKDMPRFHHHIH